ncbi:DNA alkylation repair protein [uncultured Muriicola sp.]|uniref:DNA alkylation repair protein n=1 Tax=uncultured Muriicola sp. TaxID=1583102 RepID=UPI002611822B|nr:DNA alkylation repair protein [uncultured Muriicola sp.]
MIHIFLKTLEDLFKKEANASIASGQKAYMRNQFEFYGVKTPIRRGIQRKLFKKDALPPKHELHKLVTSLWDLPQRENQYVAQELARKYIRNIEEDDILLYEYMITHKSWWDTVDFIAAVLVGSYFKMFPHKRNDITKRWMSSDNIWLQRSTLLFQLKYKETLDTEFLGRTINSLLGSEEFFINKAIGWVLREYSKTDKDWVLQFAAKTSLHSLSRREALRLIK